VLLLSFQPDGGPWSEAPWAHRLHLHRPWPTVTRRQYLHLFTSLGMRPFGLTGTGTGTSAAFDPFLHEIVEVEQAEDPDEPVRILDVVWPGLWLGPLLFGRAGVRVRAGVNHAERGVADRSPLYWTFLRRHRPTVDQSLGWGHNSQWRTDFRLDYRTEDGDRLHLDGWLDLDAPGGPGRTDLHELDALLSPVERRELLRHRCLLRTPERAAELDATGDWACELYPFDWAEPAGSP
jgi:hypothetical protein